MFELPAHSFTHLSQLHTVENPMLKLGNCIETISSGKESVKNIFVLGDEVKKEMEESERHLCKIYNIN